MHYLILQHPGHNRVYYEASAQLALSELQLICSRLESTVSNPELVEIGGLPYLQFETGQPLPRADLELLSGFSFAFALFIRKGDEVKGGLHPLPLPSVTYLDPKISSLLKYPGKTNELFTRLMVNVALFSSGFPAGERLRLLDPVAGKGTTLFEGLIRGFDVYGIEKEARSVHETRVFFKKYLEAERFKHQTESRQVGGTGKSSAIMLHEFAFAPDKEAFKQASARRKLGLVQGLAQEAGRYFKKERFHLMVGDLPYGIAHANRASAKADGGSRNPSQLLAACLPEWYRILHPGGTVALSWNAHLVSREKLSGLFGEAGFRVFTEAPYGRFSHQVDRAIRRDLIVARKENRNPA
jgi:hypothetical protein